jgi:hypothetical protein
MKPMQLFRAHLLLGLAVLPMLNVVAHAAPVEETEAVSIAQLWLATEIVGSRAGLSADEQTARLEALLDPQVYYLLANDEWPEQPPTDGTVLGYAVYFPAGGYVVLPADDRLEPLLVFDRQAPLRADRGEENFLRDFLAWSLPARWDHLHARLNSGMLIDTHPNWRWLRTRLTANAWTESTGRGDEPAIYVYWDTALWDQDWPYNTECVNHNGNNSVPTGCTATAMAIKMRFHSWPPVGNSAHSYQDVWGDIQYFHSVNFGASTYDWASMPTGNVTQPNASVAQIMYHAGVAVDMNYELTASGAWPSATATNTYFCYRGTVELNSGHDAPIIASLLGGLPVVISSTAHTVVVAGYRDDQSPHYYLNCGWSGSNNGWYNLNQIPGGDPTIDRSYPYSAPTNYVYVDGAWSGAEDGTLPNPYNTVHEGNNAIPWDGHLWLKAGTYTGPDNVPVTFDKAMEITPYGGLVTIGS